MADKTTNTENSNVVSQTDDSSNGPVQTFRYKGAFIKLWEKEGEKGPFVTASIGKTYKDKVSGEFKESYSLGESDLAKVDFLMPEARKEMAQWHAYYREQATQKLPAQSLQRTDPDMIAARDSALSKAAPGQNGQAHEIKHER